MKKLWKYSLVLLILSVLSLAACDQKKTVKHEEHTQQYTCAMHPQIVKDKFGQCPICKMNLVAINQKEVKMEVDASLATLIQPANEVITSNIKTITVKASTQNDTLKLNGIVTYNSNNLKRVSSRLSGRVEKLYVKYNFQKVSKGQKIMEIYSPDLASSQQELIYLKSNGDANLLAQAKSKLRLLGVEENQINQILKTEKVNYKIAVYSPVSGYIIDNKQSQSTVTNLGDEANNESSTLNIKTNTLAILEGAYVNTGDLLFQLFEPKNVWAEFYVPAFQTESLSTKTKLSIISQKGIKTAAKIDLIQPYFNEGQNYKVARVYLNNNNQQFKIGELLKAEVLMPALTGFWIPTAAVYQLGQKNIVFIKKGSIIKPKEVVISIKSNQHFLIKSGINEGDKIASNASFLIDTESFIEINE